MSGTINFSYYPVSNRVPGVYAEVDASGANTGQINQTTLIIGQMLSTGNATAGAPVLSAGTVADNAAFGRGSMLASMLSWYRKADPFGTVWVLPLIDNAAGTAATGTITVTGTATAPGALNVYIAGTDVQVAVAAADTATVVAGNIVSAIGKLPDLPVTAAANAGVVTLTARHKGLAAADVDLRLNYLGAANGENTPAGLTVALAAMTGGATDPVLDTALASLGDSPFDFIVTPYTSSAQVTSVETLLSDATGRWSYLSELFGHAFSAFRGIYSALVTEGDTLNNQHVSVLGFADSPTPAWGVAANFAGVCAASLRADPALPLQYVSMQWQAPPIQSRFDQSERNTLLYNGISTFRVDQSGTVILERAVTTYQTTASGAPDDSYLNVETMFTLMFVIRAFRNDLLTKFARKKLVSNGTRISFGQNFVTPNTVLNEVIAQYRLAASFGYVQNPDQFAQQAYATDAGNGQVSLYLPIQLAQQLRVIAMLVAFTSP